MPTSVPLIAPITPPSASRIGRATSGSPRPCESRPMTRMMFTSPITGATERSMPPPPTRIAGVLAIAASAKGASVPSSAGTWLQLANAGKTAVFAMIRATVRTSAKTYVFSRSPWTRRARQGMPGKATDSDWLAIVVLAEEARHDPLSGRPVAWDLGRELTLAEDEDAVHQLDVLVDLGREHHHADA